MMSGYTPCACRDCMDVTVSWDDDTPARCSLCWEAGCEPYAPDSEDYNALPAHMRECQRDDAPECEGHQSLDGAHMGETVYCDGSCARR